MPNKTKNFIGKKKPTGKKSVLQLVTIGLCITLAFSVANLVSNLADAYRYDFNYRTSTESMLSYIQRNKYTTLRSQLGDYSKEEIEKNQTLTECYHVALYFENSMMEHAFLEIDPAQAAAYQAAAAENAANMGDLSYQKEIIDDLLEEYIK